MCRGDKKFTVLMKDSRRYLRKSFKKDSFLVRFGGDAEEHVFQVQSFLKS